MATVPDCSSTNAAAASLGYSNMQGENELASVMPRSEMAFVAGVALFLCVLTSLPYIAARRVSIPGKVFTGLIVQSYDSNNYLAYSEQAAAGQWLFRNPMTAEPHRPVFFNLEWLVIGKVAALFHLSLTGATDAVRSASLAVMCLAVYWLSCFVLRTRFARRIALIAIMLGGGFGWVVTVHLLGVRLDSSYFLDLTDANLFPFYWELKLAHFLISETFVVLGLCFFLSAERSRRISRYVAAGLCYTAAGTCRPYDMLFLMAATTLYVAYSAWTSQKNTSRIVVRLIPVLLCLAPLAYYLWIFKLHPVFRWWTIAGNAAPPAWMLAWSFGPSFFLLFFAAWKFRRGGLNDAGVFLLCCLLTAVVLAHLHNLFHFAFQFATNILIPMVLIIVLALEPSISTWRQKKRFAATAWVTVLLFVNSLTSLALTGQAVILARRGEFHTDRQLIEAYSWLDQHSQKNDVVLADFPRSSEIPDYTRDIVFCGYANAVNFSDKSRMLLEFFQPETSNEFREELIQTQKIQFILTTAAEEQSAPAIARIGLLKEVFRNGAATVYAVAKSRIPAEVH